MSVARRFSEFLSRVPRPVPNDRPFSLFLRGEFFFNVVRGYVLVVFTQSLYRASGDLWHNLIYFTSDSVFTFIVPFAIGAWVDRHGPRNLLSVCAAGTGVLLACCAALCLGGPLSATGVLGASLIASAFNAASRVCVFALIPTMVAAKELIRVNGRWEVAFQSGLFVGVLFAGLLADRIGLAGSFVLMSSTAAAACWFYTVALRSVDVVSRGGRPADQIRYLDLVSALLRSPMLIALFVVAASDVVAVSLFNIALPALVARHFRGSSLWFAVIDSLFTFGTICLGWTAGHLSVRGRQFHPLLVLMPLTTIAWICQLSWFVKGFFLLLTFFVGYAVGAYAVYFAATVQAVIPADLRGRFAALRRMFSTAMVAIAVYCYAASYAKAGTRGAIAATLAFEAVALAGGVVWILARKRLRERTPPPEFEAAVVAATTDHDDLKPVFERFVARLPSSRLGKSA